MVHAEHHKVLRPDVGNVALVCDCELAALEVDMQCVHQRQVIVLGSSGARGTTSSTSDMISKACYQSISVVKVRPRTGGHAQLESCCR